jgi:short-subunit dehydrogenase
MIVTGASSGIGRALAVAAARDGFAVLLVARRADRLEEVARSIREAGGTCESVTADVIARDAPQRVVDAAVSAFARIDVVVNNAGAGSSGPLLAQTDADLERQWQLHVAAPLRIARAALPQLERVKGQLVFIGSGLARVPLPNYGAYAPAKAAIRTAAIQLRRELRERGIAVTYVDPGVVATEFHGTIGERRSSRVKAVEPERVARAILRGIERRTAMIAAVPLVTAGTVAGEWLAALADPMIARMAPQWDASVAPQLAVDKETPAVAEAETTTQRSDFEAALEPVARRMERVKLPISFLQSIVIAGATLELNEVAMRWAGMPNKNERAALREVFEALTAGGYLESEGDERFRVARGADEPSRT